MGFSPCAKRSDNGIMGRHIRECKHTKVHVGLELVRRAWLAHERNSGEEKSHTFANTDSVSYGVLIS